MVSFVIVRDRCRRYAVQFGFPLYLFERIPSYIFYYFKSADPFGLNYAQSNITQLDIMIVFILINNISSNLIMAFYAAGDQNVETVFGLHTHFDIMWRLYRATDVNNANELFRYFGTFFAYHLESRTLRRIDMSIVTYNSNNRGHFLPDSSNWRHYRNIRQMILNGQFRVDNDYDIQEIQRIMRDGFLQRGRH